MTLTGTSRESFSEVTRSLVKSPSLGVVRLDSDYIENHGDICSLDSYGYHVFYKVVPGFTFEMCQSGKLSKEVEKRFKQTIKWLAEEKKVDAITSSCGFMIYFQNIARKVTKVPVF